MLTMRPSPASRIEVKAARQHRNEPVRLTASVLCQISVVVSAKGAEVSDPAAQTSAAGGPAAEAAAKRRSTSSALLTSVVAALASPPASRMRRATTSRACASRAAKTTWAPAAAIASAVAAPIPRLAPVTTASRPASQCPGSATDRDLHAAGSHVPVKPLVCIETELQIEMALRVPPALGAREPARPLAGFGRRTDVPGRDQQARHALHDDFLERATAERHNRRAARLRLGGEHPERLGPPGGAENHPGAAHRIPERRSRDSRMNADARGAASRADPLARAVGGTAVAPDIDRG